VFGSGGRYLECLASLKRFDLGKDFTLPRENVVALRERRRFLFSQDAIVAMCKRERQDFSWLQIISPLRSRQHEFSWRERTLFLKGRWRCCRGEGDIICS